MKKIAIPVMDNKLSRHFGHCEKFYFYEIANAEVIKEIKKVPPPYEPGLLPKWLSRHLVTDVIAGGLIGYLLGWLVIKTEQKYKFGEKVYMKDCKKISVI